MHVRASGRRASSSRLACARRCRGPPSTPLQLASSMWSVATIDSRATLPADSDPGVNSRPISMAAPEGLPSALARPRGLPDRRLRVALDEQRRPHPGTLWSIRMSGSWDDFARIEEGDEQLPVAVRNASPPAPGRRRGFAPGRIPRLAKRPEGRGDPLRSSGFS